jgi:hypothetical protein
MVGCGAKKDAFKHDGLTLRYSMPKGKVLKYRFLEEFSQEMEVAGNSMVISADETRLLSIRPQMKSKDQYRVGVTIDSMTANLVSPQGTFSPDLTAMHGKTCEFAVSELGKETDVMSGEPIEYEIFPGQTQNAASVYQAFFPDLPNRPVKEGDSWVSTDTIFEKNDKGQMTIIFNSTNKLEGFETIGGVRCAKVLADVTGTLDGLGHEGGVELVSKLTITGSETWYFDYKKGAFVKSVSSGIGEGTVVGSGAQKLNIPMKREYSYVTELIE